MDMRIATHQLSAIRASLVAAMEQLDGLQMVIDANNAAQPEVRQVEVTEEQRREEEVARPTFGRAKGPPQQSGDR